MQALNSKMLACAAALVLGGAASGVEFGDLQHAEVKITTARIDLRKEQLRLFLRDDSNQPIKSFQRLEELLAPKGEHLVFGMNAGMYHGDFSPVGLCILDGKQVAPLNLENSWGNFFLKPNAVFCITTHGARIVESSRVPQVKGPLLLATQSGPALVLDGRIHPAFKPGSTSRLRRNGVGVVNDHEVIFAISEGSINFHDFATFFRDVLHCQNALYLDGTISSLHAPQLNRSDKKMDLGPIIGVTRRL